MEKKISDKTIEIDDLINNSNRNLKSNSSIGKLFVRFAFSHIGLIILVIAFIVGGAFLFQLLEQHASIQKCQEGEGKSNNLIKSYRTALFNYIRLNLTEIETLLYKEVNLTSLSNYDLYVQKRIEFINSYHKDAQTFLMNLRDEVLLIEKTYKYRGQNCINETSWTIESSLLYTLTLLSTIGYGHVTPITWEGQIVCICFSMIGIPLFLLTMADISLAMSKLFKSGFNKVVRILFLKKESKKNECVEVYDPTKASEARFVEDDRDEDFFETNEYEENITNRNRMASYRMRKSVYSVPLIIALFIFALYIMIGSLIFEKLEDLGKIKSSYFSFITVATIGFGDIVPGLKYIGNDNKMASRNLLISALYIFFGIGILAMCFDLIQETLMIRFSEITDYFSRQKRKSENFNKPKNVISGFIETPNLVQRF